jgi:hypothetical protein
MENIGLSEKALKAIKDNAELYGKVSKVLDVAPISLPRLLYSNDPRLTQAIILKLLRKELKCNDAALLVDVAA